MNARFANFLLVVGFSFLVSACGQTFHKSLMNSDSQRYLLVWGDSLAHFNKVEQDFHATASMYCPHGYNVTGYGQAYAGMDLDFLFGQPFVSTKSGLEGAHRIEATIQCRQKKSDESIEELFELSDLMGDYTYEGWVGQYNSGSVSLFLVDDVPNVQFSTLLGNFEYRAELENNVLTLIDKSDSNRTFELDVLSSNLIELRADMGVWEKWSR